MWTSRLVRIPQIETQWEKAYNAVGCMCRLGFAIELITEALYVVKPVCDDNVIAGESSLHCRVLFGSSVFLCAGCMVDLAGESQGLIVDVMHLQSANAGVRGAGYFLVEIM